MRLSGHVWFPTLDGETMRAWIFKNRIRSQPIFLVLAGKFFKQPRCDCAFGQID
jgi:hypothetical protein